MVIEHTRYQHEDACTSRQDTNNMRQRHHIDVPPRDGGTRQGSRDEEKKTERHRYASNQVHKQRIIKPTKHRYTESTGIRAAF